MVVRQNSMNLWFNWSWSDKYYLPNKISKKFIYQYVQFSWELLLMYSFHEMFYCGFKATESNVSNLVKHKHVYINSHTFLGSSTNWRKSTCICICQQRVQEMGHMCPRGHFTWSWWHADGLPWHQNELQCRCSTQKHGRSSCHSCRPWKVSRLHSGTHPRRYG